MIFALTVCVTWFVFRNLKFLWLADSRWILLSQIALPRRFLLFLAWERVLLMTFRDRYRLQLLFLQLDQSCCLLGRWNGVQSRMMWFSSLVWCGAHLVWTNLVMGPWLLVLTVLWYSLLDQTSWLHIAIGSRIDWGAGRLPLQRLAILEYFESWYHLLRLGGDNLIEQMHFVVRSWCWARVQLL